MLARPPVERLPLPVLPTAGGRSGFPLVATLAPIGVAVALWAVTQSPYSLLFALLGPVVALGGLIDGRISRRRSTRRELERFRGALVKLGRQVDAEHDAERERLRQLAPIGALASGGQSGDRVRGWAHDATGRLPVSVGRGVIASPVEVSGDDPDEIADEVRTEISALRARSSRFDDAPVVIDARDGIGLVGPQVASAAIARGIALQLAARLSPATTTLATCEAEREWADALPHGVSVREGHAHRFEVMTGPGAAGPTATGPGVTEPLSIVVAWAESAERLPLGCGVVLRLDGDGVALESHSEAETGAGAAVGAAELIPLAASARRARQVAEGLRSAADAHGLRAASDLLPDRVDLGALVEESRAACAETLADGLVAPIGRDANGPVLLDLVADGPHAIVAGTTGSGKSELLVSWVLGIASLHPPERVTFVLVDFKGGAAFAPLAGLPHVLATLSDLDARLTRRAIESLRAELLHRERTLAEHRVRSIDELPSGLLPRLVVVVDEFAAVVAESPALHEVFTDLAARGRSLGLHLVLCTQRPSGVIRDAVLANVTVRLSLRVTDRGDSTAMIGSDAASRLPAEPRGRAVLLDGSGMRDVQLAIADRSDADRVRASAGSHPLAAPWCDPLPEQLALEALPVPERGYAFGLVDLPSERRQPPAAHEPSAHGHLLVVGAARSGKTTALAAIAASATRAAADVQWLADDPADAWGQLIREVGDTDGHRGTDARLLLIDDLDLLISRLDDDYRHEALELVTRLAREGSARGLSLVATAQRLPGALSALGGLFGSRMLLRHTSREEYVLAGGDGPQFDADLPPGAGRWRGAVVQVAIAGEALERRGPQAPPRVRVGDHPILALVTARPRGLATRLRAEGARVVELGATAIDPTALHVARGRTPTILLGDPDAWNADWATLTLARRELPMVILGCTPADHRALLRDRQLPPLLGRKPDECWLADGGRTIRAVLDLETTAATPRDSVVNSTDRH